MISVEMRLLWVQFLQFLYHFFTFSSIKYSPRPRGPCPLISITESCTIEYLVPKTWLHICRVRVIDKVLGWWGCEIWWCLSIVVGLVSTVRWVLSRGSDSSYSSGSLCTSSWLYVSSRIHRCREVDHQWLGSHSIYYRSSDCYCSTFYLFCFGKMIIVSMVPSSFQFYQRK